MANKKRRAGRAADHDHDQVNLPDLIATEEEEQGRVKVDHPDDKNNESGVPFWISAWWRDYQMPHMLVRWEISVCAVALFYKQMKDKSLLLTLALSFHVSIYTKRIYSTLRDGVPSAKNGYDAFKLFLRALPEYDIWYYNARPFLLGLIMSKAPVEMGLLLLILAASYSLAYLRGRGRGRGHGRGRGGGHEHRAYQRGSGRGGGRDVDIDVVGAYERGHGRGRGQPYQRGRGRAR